MLKTLARVGIATLVTLSLGLSAVPARADNSAATATMVSGANTAIKSAMDASKVSQVPPVNQQPVGGKAEAGLPTGFTYFADFSIAKPYGDIGNMTNWLPGGFDAMASWGFNPANRFVASWYELQHYPYGFNSGTVPTYLPSSFPSNPGVNPAPTNLAAQNLNLTTKDKFLLLSFEHLFDLKAGDKTLPLVVTPTYVSRSSYIAQSGNGTDQVPFVDQVTGQPVTGVDTRTAQYWSVAVTVPFLKTSKMFGTFTVAPTWLNHLNGVNEQNSVQLYQILYLEYNATKTLRFFFEPQSTRDYLPTDYYAQHLFAYFLGATQRIGKEGFIQATLNSGSPTNYSPYGVAYLKCYALPCSQNTVPAIGGLKATQIQIQFGIGSPTVLPF